MFWITKTALCFLLQKPDFKEEYLTQTMKKIKEK